MNMQTNYPQRPPAPWIALYRSFFLMLGRPQLFGWSLLLVLITALLTWVGYLLSFDVIDNYSRSLFSNPPATDSIWGYVQYYLWLAGDWLFGMVARIVSFYLAFLLAYSLTTPGYAFLSTAAEKIEAKEQFAADQTFRLGGFFIDIGEGIKIALLGVIVTILAFVVNFVPAVGQAAVILLYIYYSALMFLDYPMSRRRWSLGEKLSWMRRNSGAAFRLGLLPALLSMIPILNIFVIALIFPLFTIHATLNFTAIEVTAQKIGARHGN